MSKEIPQEGVSVTIYTTYKDFPVTFTKTAENGSLTPMIEGTKKVIDTLSESGFTPILPGGDKVIFDTGKVKELEGKTEGKEVDPSLCSVHDVKMKKREGKNGSVFYSHARKKDNDDWEYCSGKGYK